jgi:hypothetical protein
MNSRVSRCDRWQRPIDAPLRPKAAIRHSARASGGAPCGSVHSRPDPVIARRAAHALERHRLRVDHARTPWRPRPRVAGLGARSSGAAARGSTGTSGAASPTRPGGGEPSAVKSDCGCARRRARRGGGGGDTLWIMVCGSRCARESSGRSRSSGVACMCSSPADRRLYASAHLRNLPSRAGVWAVPTGQVLPARPVSAWHSPRETPCSRQPR